MMRLRRMDSGMLKSITIRAVRKLRHRPNMPPLSTADDPIAVRMMKTQVNDSLKSTGLTPEIIMAVFVQKAKKALQEARLTATIYGIPLGEYEIPLKEIDARLSAIDDLPPQPERDADA